MVFECFKSRKAAAAAADHHNEGTHTLRVCECYDMRLSPREKGDELCCVCYGHFNSLSDYAENMKLITLVVFMFWVIKKLQSALCERTGDIGRRVVVCGGWTFLQRSEDVRC